MAAYTLFDLAYRVGRELGYLMEGTATTGATTNVTDTVYLKDRFPDSYFVAGPVFIIYDAAGAGAAPQGEWGRISAFVKTTGVATIATALTIAVAAGDRYAIGNDEFTLDTLILNINAALSELQIKYVDTTTIDTDTNITEHNLPAAVLDQNIQVWIQRSTTTAYNLWTKYHDWYVAETATGTAKKLIFRTQPPEPWDVKIEYWLPHPPLYTAAGKMAEIVNINRIVAEAALKCLMWKKAQKSQVDPVLDERIQVLMGKVAQLQSRYPMPRPGPKLATYGHTNSFDYGDT